MTLLNLIKKDKNLRRIFGKQELEIIERQILGIKLKPSEKTRLSRDIKKKFEAVEALSRFSDEFKLKKGAEIKKIVNQVKDDILESRYFPRIKMIYLFGSAVENEVTFRSDIDIAVEFDSISQKEATEFRIKFSANDKVDIQVYNILPEKIKKEIDTKGKVIYERK